MERMHRTPRHYGIVRDDPYWETQLGVIRRVEQWLRDPNAPRVFYLTAPTGSGKSLIAETIAQIVARLHLKTVIVTPRRGLVEQMSHEFRSEHAQIQGKVNYQCGDTSTHKDCTCRLPTEHDARAARGECGPLSASRARCAVIRGSDGLPDPYAKFCQVRKDGLCEYYNARERAKESDVVVGTYAGVLSYAMLDDVPTDDLPGSGNPYLQWSTDGESSLPFLLICDEGHLLEQETDAFASVSLDYLTLRIAGAGWENLLPGPSLSPEELEVWGQSSIVQWAKWAKDVLIHADQLPEATETGLRKISQMDSENYMATMVEGVYDQGLGANKTLREGPCLAFRPILPDARFLLNRAERVLAMSATLIPELLEYAGAPSVADAAHLEIASAFPPANTPVRVHPAAINMKYQADRNQLMEHGRQFREAVYGILADGARTLVTSTANRYVASEKSPHAIVTHAPPDLRSRMTYNIGTDGNGHHPSLWNALIAFKSGEASILVSASTQFGVDFPDDECRRVIIPAVPYPTVADVIVRKRKELLGWGWYNGHALSAVVQMAGRASRSPEDWSHVWIMDTRWPSFYRRHQHLAPKYFRDRVT